MFCRSSSRLGFIDPFCNSSFSSMFIVELPGTFVKYTKSALPSASEIPHCTISYRQTPCAFAFLRSVSMFCCKGSNAMYLSQPHSVSTRNCSLTASMNIPVFAPTSRMMPPRFGRMPFLKYTFLSTISSYKYIVSSRACRLQAKRHPFFSLTVTLGFDLRELFVSAKLSSNFAVSFTPFDSAPPIVSRKYLAFSRASALFRNSNDMKSSFSSMLTDLLCSVRDRIFATDSHCMRSAQCC